MMLWVSLSNVVKGSYMVTMTVCENYILQLDSAIFYMFCYLGNIAARIHHKSFSAVVIFYYICICSARTGLRLRYFYVGLLEPCLLPDLLGRQKTMPYMEKAEEIKEVSPIVLISENQKDRLKEITDRLEQGILEVFESACDYIEDNGVPAYIQIAQREECIMAVVGPENPLAEGIADNF